jgi:FMN phosphatase YigB (HAD superfamily)
MTQSPDPARFAHVTDWVFDLDNTLYPHHSNLFAQIDAKMTTYVAELLTLSREDARKLQKELYLEYGTTLNGLMERHNIDPDDFLEKVHDIDYSWRSRYRHPPASRPQVHLHQRRSRPCRARRPPARHPRPFRRHLRHRRRRTDAETGAPDL